MLRRGGDDGALGVYFAAVLGRIALTRGSIMAFRQLAIANLTHFREIWLAVREALYAVGRDSGDKTQATWYAVDGLLKDAPFVYGSYVARELPSLCQRFLPFREKWVVELLRQWVPLLPVNSRMERVAEEAAAEYAQAQLEDELATTAAQHAGPDGDEPASPEELRALQEAVDRVLAAARERRAAAGAVRVKLESVKAEPGIKQEQQVALARVAGTMVDKGNTRDTAIDADEEYVPSYVAGARMGRLRRECDALAASAPAGAPSAVAAAAAAQSAPAETRRERRVRPRQ